MSLPDTKINSKQKGQKVSFPLSSTYRGTGWGRLCHPGTIHSTVDSDVAPWVKQNPFDMLRLLLGK